MTALHFKGLIEDESEKICWLCALTVVIWQFWSSGSG